MADYNWVTNEMFMEKLGQIVNEHTGADLLMVPGVYEVLSEHFNNQVLEELAAEHDYEEDNDSQEDQKEEV